MLTIHVPTSELYDPVNNLFSETKEQTIVMEHSLISISKWESKWNKPFISNDKKTYEETIDYIRCMTLSKNVDELVYATMTQSTIDEITAYIDAPMTATWFAKDNRKPSREIVTSEVIYYWMIALNIPFECQKWHLNRLLTLIRVCDENNKPKKKMSNRQLISRNRSLNEARKRALHSRG